MDPASGEFEGSRHRGTVAIHTLGCKLNQADSDALARRFVSAGYRMADSEAGADVVVLNTCHSYRYRRCQGAPDPPVLAPSQP